MSLIGQNIGIKKYKSGSQPVPVYEILDHITCSQQQYLDTDIYAKDGIKVEMTAIMTSRPGNTRIWSTHDPVDFPGQNWAFASGCWGLQFEGNQLCVKVLGANDSINSFDLLSYYFQNVQNQKLRYELACAGLLEIYDTSDTLVYTFDSSSKVDPTKVSQTTIRLFGREDTEPGEFFVGDVYDVKIYDNSTLSRHYIPVKRLSDNVVGLYESETRTFLLSSTGTDFTGVSKSTPEYIYGTQDTILDIVIKKYKSGAQRVPVYEILDYLITPQQSSINTDVLVDGTTIVELDIQLNQSVSGGPRFWASNDTNTDVPGWGERGTWSYNFEGQQLGIKPFGAYRQYAMTNVYMNDILGLRLRHHQTAAGSLNIYRADDTLYYTFDFSSYADPTYSSSTTPIKLFHRYASHEYINPNSYVYDSKIWKNSTLIRHYIPVKRLSDNVYGLYDEVNDTFHPNEASGYDFTGVSKSTPEYIYESGSEQVLTITPVKTVEVASRYIPAQYCQNNSGSSTYQDQKATFSLPWAPDPTIPHKIVVDLMPLSRPSESYGWSVYFGGNVSSLNHMANIFGGCIYASGSSWFGAYEPNVELTNSTNYYNQRWHIEIDSQAGTASSHTYSVKIDVDGTNMLDSVGTSSNNITGTYDPYFIFGGQILRSSNNFSQVQFKLYSFDIYDDNVLVYSLRPYYDTVDQLYGMYDLVNDTFYSSINSNCPFVGEL